MSKVTKAAEMVNSEGNEDEVVVVDGFDTRLGGAKLVTGGFVMNGMSQLDGGMFWVQFIEQRLTLGQGCWCRCNGDIEADGGVLGW